MILSLLLTYWTALWLGLYLLDRDFSDRTPTWLGAGLLGYAVLAAGVMLWPPSDDPLYSTIGWTTVVFGVGLLLASDLVTIRAVLEQGESLLPDLVRSLDGAILATLSFGAPVGLTMWLSTGTTHPLLALLLVITALAIASQVLAEKIQRALDRVAFAALPQLQQQRADLRAVAEALPKASSARKFGLDVPTPNPLDAWDEEEFARLTRRALSHFGNLPKLTASPLGQLPLVDERLAEHERDNSLARAAALKALLDEAIAQLKPESHQAFGTTDEWRFYNALYFPYVVGLRPHSRRATHDDLNPAAQQALAWFRSQVPERTLYNWQSAAAKLVAQYLREQSNASESKVIS